MSHAPAPLLDRICRGLARAGGPRSTGSLASEFLGLGILDEALAERLLGPTLAGDPRLQRVDEGWILRRGGDAAPPGTPLAAEFVAAFAPWQPPVAALAGGGAPAFTVAVGGEAEVRRAEERLRVALPRPVVDLAACCRRVAGYKGPPEPQRMLEVLGIPHLEADTPDAHAAMAGSLWRSLAASLAAEDVHDVAGLDSLLEARLERAAFDDRAFGPLELAALPAGPGAYLFRDRQRRALYVGQSMNLAARVGSYFSGPPRDEKDRVLRRDAVHLATKSVDTAPDALVLEAEWIRRFVPRLNAKLEVRASASEDGVMLLPAATPGRFVAFVLARGALALRVAFAAGPRRTAVACGRAAAALFDPPPQGEREPGALVDAWRRAHPGVPFLRPAIDGGAAQVAARLEELVRAAGAS